MANAPRRTGGRNGRGEEPASGPDHGPLNNRRVFWTQPRGGFRIQKDTRKIEGRFLAATLILFGVLSLFVLREFFYYIVGGLLLVFAFFPIHRRIRRVVRRRAPAAFISFLLVIVVVVGPIVLVGFMIFQDAVNFSSSYNPERLNETIQSFLVQYGIEDEDQPSGDENATANQTVPRPGQLANRIGNAIKTFADRLGEELLREATGLVIGLVIAAFVIYYGFAEGETFYAKFRHALPLPDEIEDKLFREIARVTQVVFIGNILVSVLGGVIGAISFVIFGVPNPVFWGFIMIVLGILPVVGAPLIWAPAAFWLFINGHTFQAIGLLLVNLVIVIGYIDNILRPKLIGKAANVHPIAILIGVLGGVEAFGALGFVIGPLVLAIFIALVRAYIEWHPRWRERRERGLERYSPSAEIDLIHERPPPQAPPPPVPPPSGES